MSLPRTSSVQVVDSLVCSERVGANPKSEELNLHRKARVSMSHFAASTSQLGSRSSSLHCPTYLLVISLFLDSLRHTKLVLDTLMARNV